MSKDHGLHEDGESPAGGLVACQPSWLRQGLAKVLLSLRARVCSVPKAWWLFAPQNTEPTQELDMRRFMSWNSFTRISYLSFPIRLCEVWPPAPTDNERGSFQNKFVFKTGLVYIDDQQMENAEGVADKIADSVARLGLFSD